MSEDIWTRAQREREEAVAIRPRQSVDARVWDLSGIQVVQIVVDPGQTSLVIGSGYLGDLDQLTICLENIFTIRQSDVSHTVDPGVAESLIPVLRLLSQEVASVTAARDGSLALRFRNGSELLVTKDSKYESWHTFGAGAFSNADMLCSPHEGPPWGE